MNQIWKIHSWTYCILPPDSQINTINRLRGCPMWQYFHVPFQKTVLPRFIKGCHMNDWKISEILGVTSPNCLREHSFPQSLIFPCRGICSLTWALPDWSVNMGEETEHISSILSLKASLPIERDAVAVPQRGYHSWVGK